MWLLPALYFAYLPQPAQLAQKPKTATVRPQENYQQQRIAGLSSEKNLQQKVTFKVSAIPLKRLLAQLSQQTGVPFRVNNRQIAEQRVTLAANELPLHQLITRLSQVLSHGSTSPSCFRWDKETEVKNGQVTYVLVTERGYTVSVQKALDQPRLDALNKLKDWRKNPFGLAECYALKNLTDAQLNDLLNGRRIVVPTTQDFIDARRKQYEKTVAAYKERGDPRDFSPFEWKDTEITLGASVSGDERRLFSNMPIYMLLAVPGRPAEDAILSGGIGLNNDGLRPKPETGLLPVTKEGNLPVYDLEPVIKAKEVTEEQKADLAFNLAALSKVAGVNVFCETFLHGNPTGFPPKRLNIVKGTLPELFNAICREWGYIVVQDGNDYQLWSRSWVFDKQADITESQITAFRRTWEQHGDSFSDGDLVGMASRLNYEQMAFTLPFAFPKMTPLNTYSEYRYLRIIGLLSAEERRAALAPDGVAVNQLSAPIKDFLAQEANQSPQILPQLKPFSRGGVPKDFLTKQLFLYPYRSNDIGVRRFPVDIGKERTTGWRDD